MKIVILAGGLGTRLSEYTKTIPKPMVVIRGKPILIHIMDQYAKYGFKEFIIALGYKGHIIQKYFSQKNYKKKGWKVDLVKTGKNTMTGGRLKRLKKHLLNESFMLTYGDGLSNVNLKKLLKFHKSQKKIITVTAVRPPARFGALKLKGKYVSYFKEKSQMDEGWINGGFFVIEPKFLNFIKSDNTFLEREPLEKATKIKQLVAYKHDSFWQCMDTIKDKEKLEEVLKKKLYNF
ncbi:sugar phosphate nucleotidyltransferase [Pelagibacteraceae bacterium]|nr:sugar phosphate nucleotidyltransferase [Pelagibacteraceae bacterium]